MAASTVVRETSANDLDAVLGIHHRAFGGDEEAGLVDALLADPTAAPYLSLVAERDGTPIGHVLFTAARIDDTPSPGSATILAPLAVDPAHQGSGVGNRLVTEGLDRLRRTGAMTAFVFGDPAYYGRFGFEPALPFGLSTPYPIAPEYEYGWQVVFLGDAGSGEVSGKLVCADALMHPEYWSP